MNGLWPPFRFALRLLRRDWRAGELRVLVAALVVAVAAVSSVSFFTDRIHQALVRQANELLGADLVVSADRAIREPLTRAAREHGLDSAITLSFPSMALAGGGTQLAWLSAVDGAYPLRGAVRTAPAPFAPDSEAEGVPRPGTVWAEPRLLSALHIGVGDTLQLGAATFRVDAVLTHDPGQAGSLFNIAPRLLLNRADIPATQLVQPASRVRYRLLVAGGDEAVGAFRTEIEDRLQRGESLQGVRDARPEIRTALERAERFLGLAALTSVVLAGVAVALAARRFAQRHLDHCAIMRCLGATQGRIIQVYLFQMLVLGLVASAAGALLGYVAHLGLVGLLGNLVGVTLPPPSAWPVVAGLATGLMTLMGFAAPPLLQLQGVPALRVLRRELGTLRAPGALTYGAGVAALAALLLWQAADLTLGAIMIGGLLASVLLLAGVAGLLVLALRRLGGGSMATWRFGLRGIARRPAASVIQVAAFGLGIMALLVLTVVRGDLLGQWQAALPDEAPNRFIINIQPDQVPPLRTFFVQQGLEAPRLYPMVRGRLVAINEDPVRAEQFDDEHAQRLAERETNLSWAWDLPPDNRIVQGGWFEPGDQGAALLSLEQGIAETLGIGLGDRLTYDVGGRRFTAQVASLREVDWDTFRANFFVLAAPGLLDDYPATYMTSFYLPEARFQLLNDLMQRFPNVTVIDVAAIMSQVRSIIERVTLAVEYVFVFTVVAGIMVLFAAIQSTHDERVLENAVLRTLGGRRRQLLAGLWVEFAGLGVLSGLLAAVLATALSYVLASRVLELEFVPNPWLWAYGVIGGAAVVGVAGYLGSRSVLRRPPLEVLRRL